MTCSQRCVFHAQQRAVSLTSHASMSAQAGAVADDGASGSAVANSASGLGAGSESNAGGANSNSGPKLKRTTAGSGCDGCVYRLAAASSTSAQKRTAAVSYPVAAPRCRRRTAAHTPALRFEKATPCDTPFTANATALLGPDAAPQASPSFSTVKRCCGWASVCTTSCAKIFPRQLRPLCGLERRQRTRCVGRWPR